MNIGGTPLYLELRFHGRGGQGAVTAATILARAALLEGKWAQAIPNFGAERRGAPVEVYARVSDTPIQVHSSVERPDVVVVLDYELLKMVDVTRGLKEGGTVVINSPVNTSPIQGYKTYCVNATKIAKELGLVVSGWPTVNTAMLGALSKATNVVSVESITKAISEYFTSPALAKANGEAALRSFNEARLC
jgi:2-oxoacid:acceptor oxidoreductase gamma subunit (pyruvate/2-ketoisovalerate family)